VDADDALGLLLETLSVLGLALGGLFLLIALAVRASDGDWVETTAVLVGDSDGGDVEARWMTEDGSLHSRRLDSGEAADLGDADAAPVFYKRRSPDRIRFHRKHEGERLFLVLAAILGGVGVASVVASWVLTLMTR
jgi:hypothetical protein